MNWFMLGWLCMFVLALAMEAATAGLVSIWFALGGIVAFIAALCGGEPWLQITLFMVVSAGSLVLTRPLCARYFAKRKQNTRTNADRNVGAMGRCTQAICNNEGRGAVFVLGKEWTARSVDGSPIDLGSNVVVESIEGVKLLVRPVSLPSTLSCSGAKSK